MPLTYSDAPWNLSITFPDMVNDSSINIKEGNYTVILCSVESFPASNLMWRHLGITMNRTSSNNELWLEFAHIVSSNPGCNQCVAENEHEAVETAITITVEWNTSLLSLVQFIDDENVHPLISSKCVCGLCASLTVNAPHFLKSLASCPKKLQSSCEDCDCEAGLSSTAQKHCVVLQWKSAAKLQKKQWWSVDSG